MCALWLWYMCLSATVGFLIAMFQCVRKKKSQCEDVKNKIPSPPKWPIIGHLHILDGNPFQAMDRLSSTYGDIYSLRLGSMDAVVVSSFPLIKSILVDKDGVFGNRANFLRYHTLFGGDKENSLAFCDWSPIQKTRRCLARKFCHSFPSLQGMQGPLDTATAYLTLALQGTSTTDIKYHINKATAIAFFAFFTSSKDFGDGSDFDHVVCLFDSIFYEINQGHPTDVLPFLAPFFKTHLKRLAGMGGKIREFVQKHIIQPHLLTLDRECPRDFVDILLCHLEETEVGVEQLTLEQVLYELEDFLGGHSAVSNLLARALVDVASVDGLTEEIYRRCLEDADNKGSAYIRAVVYETLRMTSSPIVPHIASSHTRIKGYEVKAGTMVLFNNFELNKSPEYWTNPKSFNPERFLSPSGEFVKPSHFIPFSTGRRACMGFKLVERLTEGILVAILREFHVEQRVSNYYPKMPVSSVALHPDFDLNLKFTPRRQFK